MLGPLQVTRDGAEVTITAGRLRALLAALLLRPNQMVATSELIRYLWDDDGPPDARGTTQTYIRRLRGTLGEDVIRTRPGGYLLAITPGQLDLAQFDDLWRRAGLADQPEAEATLLRDALRLWHGPVLANVPSEVLHRYDVPVLNERRLQALERRLDLDLATGRHHELVAELPALVAVDPFRERLVGQLMTALAGSGRSADALRVYEDLRRRLADELGADPSPQVQSLHRDILRGEGPGCTATTPPAALPEPAAARRPRPQQLPADVTGFTGRTVALRRLDTLLPGDDDPPPTTVVIAAVEGPPGVGKTALAVHWAYRVRHQFPDGLLYVNLRGYDTSAPVRPIEALSDFLTALGVAPEQVPTELGAAAALYRSALADRRVLVILDNAAYPDQVRPLLPGGSRSLVLVTSRNQLAGLAARDGAHRLVIKALVGVEAQALLSRLLGADRVREEPAAAAELARLCGSLPLALRVAAANLTAQPGCSLAAYVDQLRDADRMAALAVPDDAAADVSAAFDLSYVRLSEPARRLFRLLGLFPGPDIAADPAAALADTTPARLDSLLKALVSAHLLDQVGAGRYAMHDLLRSYAADWAHRVDSAGQRTAARDRLYGYYLSGADAAARLLYPHMRRLPQPPPLVGPTGAVTFTDHDQALAWLDDERVNLVTVVARAAVDGPYPVAWWLADALRGYFLWRGHTVEWLTAATAALRAAEVGGDQNAQAVSHWSLAGLGWRRNDYSNATEHAERALTLTRSTGWLDGQGAALGNLGSLYFESGRLERAIALFTEALRLFERAGCRPSPTILGNLGLACFQLGRLVQAAQYADRALTINDELRSPNVATTVRGLLGEVHHATGRLDLAVDHLTQALSHARTAGNRIGEGEVLACLAAVHRDEGRLARADLLAREALAIARDVGHGALEVESLQVLGSVQHRRGQQADAIESLERAVSLAAAATDPYLHVRALLEWVAASRHRRHAADARLTRALTLARDFGFRLLEGRSLTTLARRHLDRGEADAAITSAEQALVIHRETGNRLGEARTHLVLGHAHRCAGDSSTAARHWREARVGFENLGLPMPRRSRRAPSGGGI